MKYLLAALLLCAPCSPAWPRAGGGGGGGGGGCFAAGTLVSTTAGDVIIEAVRPGDLVLAYADGRVMEVAVKEFFKKKARLLTVTTPLGRVVTTPEHPFLTRNGFTEAANLKPGDEVGMLRDGKLVWTKRKKLKSGRETDVYNLEVAPPHTFIANGFVVHNKGGYGGGYHSRGRSKFDLIFILLMLPFVLISKLKDMMISSPPPEKIISGTQTSGRAQQTKEILSALAASDPSVEPDSLRRLVEDIFLDMQKAWEARDYGPLQSRIDPGLYASHTNKTDAMLAKGVINRMENVSVRGIDFVHVRYTPGEADRSFTVLITASACDYTVNEGSGTLVSGSRFPHTFQEFWTFRLFNGRWVPARIDQTSEDYILTAPNLPEKPGPAPLPAAVVGLAVAAAAVASAASPAEQPASYDSSGDPWDRQRMEIAATLAFLNVYAAWESLRPDEIQADAVFPETLQKLKALMLDLQAQGFKFELGDLYTKKADIVLTSKSGPDEFTARINASARRALSHDGKQVHRDTGPEPFTEYWVFGRSDNGKWLFKDILPRIKQEGGDACQADIAPSPVQIEWYWKA
jgi:predicted lipid-binding transport protein (Tim44 family)